MLRIVIGLLALALAGLGTAQEWGYGILALDLTDVREGGGDEITATWTTSRAEVRGTDQGFDSYVAFCEELMRDPDPNPCAGAHALPAVLDHLGARGWELVSVSPVVSASTTMPGGEEAERRRILYYFKRPADAR